MRKPHAVILTHEGERSPKLVGIGLAVCAGSLPAFALDATFGVLVLVAGIAVVAAGAQKRTLPCPRCRTLPARPHLPPMPAA
ncbi:MAG TPA: hypothetical protein VNX21_00325, partial [Candidatus Thermoplasmatota archaeon]|nr:hypothetical protein [Candidatus Thermoplasmatota archaeon]